MLSCLVWVASATLTIAHEPSMVDLARSYLAFERVVHTHGWTGVTRLEANASFDQLTLNFFLGDAAGAIARLDALTARIDPARAAVDERACDALTLVCEQRWRAKGHERPLIALVRTHDGHAVPDDWDAPVFVHAVPLDGSSGWTTQARWQQTSTRQLQTVTDAQLPAGVDVELRLQVGTAPARRLCTLEWLDAPPEQLRSQALAQLATIEADGPPLEQAHASLEARAKRFRNRVDPASASSVLFQPGQEWRALQADLTQLAQGEDPYRRRSGATWRVVRTATRTIPVRVHAPAAARDDQPLPLVIALHGAGGDEHHWLEAYGAGQMARLAERDGVLVAAPAVGFASWSAEDHSALVRALVYCYAIDLKRVMVIGHSMGAAAAAQLAATPSLKLAAVACLAGGPRGAAPKASAPLLVLSGERDSIVAHAPLRTAAEAWRAAGLPVDFRALPDEGHTLLVAEHLDEVWTWMLKPQR